jgi:hypothetical protein
LNIPSGTQARRIPAPEARRIPAPEALRSSL